MTFTAEFFDSEFPVRRREEIRVVVERLKNTHSPAPQSGAGGRKSNTMVFALKYEDGVILAGDRRMTDGYYDIISDSTIKVKKLSGFSAMACAGWCNVIKYLEDNMEATCVAFRERYGKELSPEGQANHLRNLMEDWWYIYVFFWFWYVGVPVLATYDLRLGQPRIFSFGEDGYFFEPPFLAGTGCGFEAVKGLIVDHWQMGLDADSAIALAVRAMILSGVTSHGVSDARIVLPTIAIIDKKGFRWAPQGVIQGKRKELLREMGGVRCLLY